MDFLKLIKIIELNRLSFFTTKELADILNVEAKSIQNYLETLANNELITRLEKGKYCRTYLNDPLVIGSNIVSGGIISHKSALSYHQLIQAPTSSVFVSSGHQKKNKTLMGTFFQFIKIRSHKYFGYDELNTMDGTMRVTDKEKTLLDCFDQPQYAVEYPNLISILRSCQPDPRKMYEYGVKMNNISVIKRVAFLSELFQIEEFDWFRNSVATLVNEKYTLLDPSGPETGPFSSTWRIRNNLKVLSPT